MEVPIFYVLLKKVISLAVGNRACGVMREIVENCSVYDEENFHVKHSKKVSILTYI